MFGIIEPVWVVEIQWFIPSDWWYYTGEWHVHGFFFVTAIGSFPVSRGLAVAVVHSKHTKIPISFWYTRFMVGWVWVLFVYPVSRCGIIRYLAWQTKGPGGGTESTNTLKWKFHRNRSVWGLVLVVGVPFGFRIPNLISGCNSCVPFRFTTDKHRPFPTNKIFAWASKDGRIPILRRVMVGAVIRAERSLGSPRSIDTQSRRRRKRIERHVFFPRSDLVISLVLVKIKKKENKNKERRFLRNSCMGDFCLHPENGGCTTIYS